MPTPLKFEFFFIKLIVEIKYKFKSEYKFSCILIILFYLVQFSTRDEVVNEIDDTGNHQ